MVKLRSILSKLPKLMWYARGVDLPSGQAVSYLNFCVHTEMLYDERVYQALLKFAKDFFVLTGKRITVCVSTPVCPLVRDAMAKNNFTDEDFASRIRELAGHADIGYHGHFYREDREGFVRISKINYDKDLVVSAMRNEIGWLKKAGANPRVYVAGWWFMTSDIVLELERLGIEVDVSVRKGKEDTFGARYLDNDKIPDYGKPFILPPSRNILEIQSIFGPVMPSTIMKGHLSQYMKNGARGNSLFFIFPLHDWDVPKYYKNILSNVEELCRAGEAVSWMNVLDMRAINVGEKAADKIGRK